MNIDWNSIPTTYGVYLWKNANGQVIYVGKAKNLRNRMKQYFKDNLSPKNKLLIKNIVDFDFQVCGSEIDALVLEQNLINEYEPKFNIKVKASKKYPYIEVKINPNIKISVSKQLNFKKSSKYYGPYPDGFSARKIISVLSSVLPLDACLNPKGNKPCLNFEMGRCMGQCVGIDPTNEKQFVINSIEDFFKGKTDLIEDKLKERIKINNELLNFEESKKLYESLELINKIKDNQSHTFKDSKHRDIINYYSQDGIVSISIMFVRFGNINFTANIMNKQLNPDPKDAVESWIHTYYKNRLIPDEVILPFDLKWNNIELIKTNNPSHGNKLELLEIVKKHAKSKYENNINAFLDRIKGYEQAITFLKNNLREKNINIIEMVDISSTMGSQQVGAVIQFKNGEPNKSK